jgi:hypothetical protein
VLGIELDPESAVGQPLADFGVEPARAVAPLHDERQIDHPAVQRTGRP